MNASEPREDAVAVLRECIEWMEVAQVRREDDAPPIARAKAAMASLAALAQQGAEPVGYANPAEYEAFTSGQDHTFVVYRHGVHGKDAAIYATPTGAPR